MVFHCSLNGNRPPGLFSVFWLISTMLQFGWSWFILWLPTLPAFFPSLWRLFKVCQIQLVSLSPSWSTSFLVLWQVCITYLFFSFSFSVVCQDNKVHYMASYLFLLIISRFGLLAGIRSPVLKKIMHLLLLDRSWFVLIPFDNVVKF